MGNNAHLHFRHAAPASVAVVIASLNFLSLNLLESFENKIKGMKWYKKTH